MKDEKVEKVIETLNKIMQRYNKFSRYLSYPGEWGERAFRGWLVFEVFHDHLGWPIGNIVFGERYDVLMVSDDVKPLIYLETKKPGRGLADREEFKIRLRDYPTLKHAILTDGYDWLRHDIIKNKELMVSCSDGVLKWKNFVSSLHASNYLLGVDYG